MKSSVATLSPDLPFPDIEEFLSMSNKGWDSEAYIQSLLKQRGLTDIEVTTVTSYVSLPIAELMELNMTTIPFILGKYWTKEQREEHEARVPSAMQQFLEQEYGVDKLVPLEPTAIIATARKP
jgi:hypothetical protein